MERTRTPDYQGGEIFLLKMGEIVLKGLNRRKFEDRLTGNVSRRVHPYGRWRIYSRQSTVYVEPIEATCDLEGAWEALQPVFGVAGLSRAKACEKDKDAFFETAKEYLYDELMAAKSFKVESKRADKRFPMTSMELSQYVGGLLSDAFPHLKVDLYHPECTVYLEIRDFAGYVHGTPAPGAGGLPVGTAGRGIALLSGGIDSPVAAYMIAKRGVTLDMVHFFSYPYTSLEARDKVLTLAREITPYCGRTTVHVVPFTEIQEQLRRVCPESLFTLAMRRFMMRIAAMVAHWVDAGCIVTGEALGQVASQTMRAMAVTEDACDLPVFRPVIGLDKEEIVRIARKIGTFETSILPYEDCCTVFTPRHPKTNPTVEELEAVEAEMDVEGLCRKAFEGIERIVLNPDQREE